MTKIPYTKESARKLWTEARDKYQMQLDSKKHVQYEPENKWGTVNGALENLKSLKNCILEQNIDMKYLYMRW